MKFTGIDIGGTKCAVISGSIETGIQDKIKFDTTNVDETIANIIKAADALGLDFDVMLRERSEEMSDVYELRLYDETLMIFSLDKHLL